MKFRKVIEMRILGSFFIMAVLSTALGVQAQAGCTLSAAARRAVFNRQRAEIKALETEIGDTLDRLESKESSQKLFELMMGFKSKIAERVSKMSDGEITMELQAEIEDRMERKGYLWGLNPISEAVAMQPTDLDGIMRDTNAGGPSGSPFLREILGNVAVQDFYKFIQRSSSAEFARKLASQMISRAYRTEVWTEFARRYITGKWTYFENSDLASDYRTDAAGKAREKLKAHHFRRYFPDPSTD